MTSRRRVAAAWTVGRAAAVLDRLAPPSLAAEWDNVGLLGGGEHWPCRRVLVTVDLTPMVLEEAVTGRVQLIVSYHPGIFRPIRSMKVARHGTEGLVAEALSRRISVYSPHTAWDAAAGGTNDALAALCGLRNTRPFTFAASAAGHEAKVVVFVPANAVEAVAGGMFAAGAGRIGDYSQCSFRTPGEGTFFGGEDTAPRVGRRGRLERVEEIRLEAVAPARSLGRIVAAIRATHPYEEPALDVYPLSALPPSGLGQGRVGELAQALPLAKLAAHLRRKTSAGRVDVVGEGRARVRTVLVCAGSAGALPFEMEAGLCRPGTVIVTGEIRHHDALRYLRAGASAIALGHWTSERPGAAALARRLTAELRGCDVRLSRRDREPFVAA